MTRVAITSVYLLFLDDPLNGQLINPSLSQSQHAIYFKSLQSTVAHQPTMLAKGSSGLPQGDAALGEADSTSASHAAISSLSPNPLRLPSEEGLGSPGTAGTRYSSIPTGRFAGITTMVQGIGNRKTLSILLSGQLLSLLLAGAGTASDSLAFACGVSAPTFASMPVFILFALHAFFVQCHIGGNQRGMNDGVADKEAGSSGDRGGTADQPEKGTKWLGLQRRRGGTTTHPLQDRDSAGESPTKGDGSSTNGRTTYLIRRWRLLKLHNHPIFYLVAAICDVESNFFLLLSLRYTSLNSSALFYSTMAIPTTMIVSKLWLRRSYRFSHVLGAAICLAGVVSNLTTDYKEMEDDKEAIMEARSLAVSSAELAADETIDVHWEETVMADDPVFPYRMLGDGLAALAGILNGIEDVLKEHGSKGQGGWQEYIAMIGIFGTILSVIQVLALELDEVGQIFAPPEGVAQDGTVLGSCSMNSRVSLLLAYVLALYTFNVGNALFLKFSEAALLNLSLLTSEIWAVIFVVKAQDIMPGPSFYVALASIFVGVFIYELAPSPADPLTTFGLGHGDRDGGEDFASVDDDVEASLDTVGWQSRQRRRNLFRKG